MSDDDNQCWYPLPLPVNCTECGEYVGIITGWRDAATLSINHKQVCNAATDEHRRQAAFDRQFLTIADRITEEGFPCQ